MKERSIIMCAEDVIATLEGRKTQTRRVIKPQPLKIIYCGRKVGRPKEEYDWKKLATPKKDLVKACPYGQVGNRLWVRESYTLTNYKNPVYRADFKDKDGMFWSRVAIDPKDVKWYPSIFMAKNLSRITLEITDVRVERLQEISEENAKAEGTNYITTCPYCCPNCPTYIDYFRELWNSIHKKEHRWEDNCWVWVITFRRA